jgi:hypothetical protein
MDEKQLQLLWDLHAKNGGFSSFDQFKQLMSDNNARKAYFDNSNKDLGFKDYSEFDQTLKKKETAIPTTNGLQTSSKTTPSVVETPSISEKEIPQVHLDQTPADNPVRDAEYVKFLDKQTKQKPTSIGMGGVASGGNDNSIPDANAIVYANKIRKKYKDNGIDLDQVSQELDGLPKGIEDVTITNADGSTIRPYSGETLSKERATDYLSYKNKVNALKNFYGIKLSKDPDKENKANLYSELQHTNLTGDLVTDVDRINNNKNRQIDIIRSSTDDQEEQAKMINRVDENKAIWVEQNVPTPDLAKKYLDDKLTRLGVVMPSKNQKVYANDATFNGNVDNYSLEDIQKHLDPNNLIEQRIFDKYKNNKQLTDVISNSTSLDDAAIQFAAKQNPKIQAAMDVFGGDLPENLKGNLVESFLNNEDVIRLSKTDPKIASLYEKTKNSMATKYPEWETNKVAQVISQYREDNDMNNWFANVPTLDGTDKVVEQLVKDGKLTDFDKNIYESKIRPQIGVLQSVKRGVVGIPLGAVVGYESPIKTPGFLENALTGYNKSIHNAARSVEDFASYTNPSSNPTQKIDDANKLWNITQENNNIQSLIPKSKLHEISEITGNLTGSIVPLIAGGALLSGVKGGELINMALNFEGGNREKALTEFPNDPAKRYLYTALGTGIDMTLAQLIPIEKIGSGATKLFKNDIKGVINDLSNGTISNAVAKKTLLEKAATYFPELVKENAKTAGVMTGFGVFHNILDSVFGNNNMSSDDIAKDAVKQYKSTFLATPLLSALSVFGKNNKVNGKVLWDIGGNGDMYRKMLDEKLKANPDSQEVKDQLENLKNVVGVRKDLENIRIPEERKQKYLILSLNEDIWNRKASETKDELIKQKYLDKAEKFKSEKEAVYNNKDKAEEFKQYDNVEPLSKSNGEHGDTDTYLINGENVSKEDFQKSVSNKTAAQYEYNGEDENTKQSLIDLGGNYEKGTTALSFGEKGHTTTSTPKEGSVGVGGDVKLPVGKHNLELSDFHDNHEQIIKNNPDATITLYHGTINEIKDIKDDRTQGLYFTPSVKEANDYNAAQNDNAAGEYGHIYKVTVPLKDLEITSDIDNSKKGSKVWYSPEETYFRIDNPSKYKIERVDDADVLKKFSNPKAEIEQSIKETPKEELPIKKTNTGTEVEPNLGEGRKPVTLSGNTEEERQVAIERRKKQTKQTPMTTDRDKLLERIDKYNETGKVSKRTSNEANNIKIAIDNFNKTHNQKYSWDTRKGGEIDLVNNNNRKISYSQSGKENSIVENSKPLIERDENTQKVFNDLLENNVLPSARMVGGEKMSESGHDATIQDIMDGIPSQRAENYLNSLEKQIKNDDFDYGNPDKNARVTLKDALGITEEHGEPLPVEKVKEWLNTESELTPEDEITLDNIENLLTHYEQRHELPEGGISPKVQQPTQEGTGTISKPTEPNKPKEEVSNQANTETLTLDNNGNEVPPINKVEEVGNNGNDGNWEAIRKAKQVEIDKVKEAYEKQPVKTWSETMNNGLTKASKMFPEKNLYDATTSLMRQMKLGGGTGDLTPDEAVAAMHYLKMETNSKRSALADRVLESDDSIVRDVAALEDSLLKEQYDDAALEAKKITTQAGRTLNYAQAEIMNSPENGLKIRRMELTKAKGSPLTETENAWAKEQFDKQLELQKRENEVMAQKMQDTFDEKIAELKKEHEAALKIQNPTTPKARQKKSEKLKDLAKRIRTENELDKFNQSANGSIVKSSMFGDVDFKELAAQAVEYIAKAVEAGEDISKAVLESAKKFKGKFDEKEFGKNISFLITKSELPTKEEATNKIREYIKESGDTDVTNDMVGKNLIRDYVNSHIGEVDQKDLLDKAFKDLKKELPDLTKEKLIEAYLKENEFKQPTKKQLEGGINESKNSLKKLAKKELTADQEQKIMLSNEIKKERNKIKEYERRIDNNEFDENTEPPKLNKKTAELIIIQKERTQIEDEFRAKQKEFKEKNKTQLAKVPELLRAAYVNYLISAFHTLGKVGEMALMRPATESLRRGTNSLIINNLFPNLSEAALGGGEGSKWLKQAWGAFARQYSPEQLDAIYEKNNTRYEEAAKKYMEYRDSKNPNKSILQKLKNDVDDKLIKVQGSLMYKFIGGSSFADALDAFVHRSNEIEKQFGHGTQENFNALEWKNSGGDSFMGMNMDNAKYVISFIGRSHSALKTFSGRFSFALGYMARLEGAVKSGVDITNPNRILEIAHESYLDWNRGKYQQDNMILNAMKNMLSNPTNSKFKEAINWLVRMNIPVARIPLNLLHEKLVEYGLGIFKAAYMANREIGWMPKLIMGKTNEQGQKLIGNSGSDGKKIPILQQMKEEGYSKISKQKEGFTYANATDAEFKKEFAQRVRSLDGKQAATIARCLSKGLTAAGVSASIYLLHLFMGLNYGGFPHKGQRKSKDEKLLKEDELNPGQVEINGNKLPKWASDLITHNQVLYQAEMGLSMANAYNDEVKNKGNDGISAIEKALWDHVKIVEGEIPQTKMFGSPTGVVEDIAKKFKGKSQNDDSEVGKFLTDMGTIITPYSSNIIKINDVNGKKIMFTKGANPEAYNKFIAERDRLIKQAVKDVVDNGFDGVNSDEITPEDYSGQYGIHKKIESEATKLAKINVLGAYGIKTDKINLKYLNIADEPIIESSDEK